jgi:hypothetical protein
VFLSIAAKKLVSSPDYINPFFGKKHSEETIKKLSALSKLRFKDPNNLPNRLRVKVGNKIYESASKAAQAIGCAVATIRNRIMSGKFPHYSYVD